MIGFPSIKKVFFYWKILWEIKAVRNSQVLSIIISWYSSLFQMFKYKIKVSEGHRGWMKNPEILENCSTGFHFPSQSGEPVQVLYSILCLQLLLWWIGIVILNLFSMFLFFFFRKRCCRWSCCISIDLKSRVGHKFE